MQASKNNGAVSLPEAQRERWQPIRGGLLNIYRYDYQEFRFEGGRLLLRGNNGTGKSRVLALQLPFLLDGEILPQRVEPDGDQAKRMEWNLLLGGKHDDRLGYTWIEFGRLNDRGEAEYKTLGCALRAVQGSGIRQQWFFLTSQRIGRDLFLENEVGQPLSKAKLEAVIGAHGKVFGSGKVEDDRREYRQAVNGALFKLGDRYEALLNLLIQLRQPQLSRTLNEQRLSDALSQALPPLPDSVLGDVAEAFRSLEAERHELNDFIAARDSAEQFLKEYRRYIQIVARRRAEDVRKTNSVYETTMRRLRAAESAFEQAERDLGEFENQIAQLAIDEQRALAEEKTLRDSPEMKGATALEDARIASQTANTDAERAEHEANQAVTALTREQEQREAAAQKSVEAWKQTQKVAERALESAQTVGLEQKHREAFERLGLPNVDMTNVDDTAESLRNVLKQRTEGARHIEKLNQHVESARQQLNAAQEAFNQLDSQLNESIEAERGAAAKVESESAALFVEYRSWAASVAEIRPADADDVEAPFADWCGTQEADSPLSQALKEAEREASKRIDWQRADAKTRLKDACEQADALRAELRRLQDGYHQPPPIPHTRDADARLNRAGAPLWALCDFLANVPDLDRANIEAALEAAGLLDAWVTPEGRVLDPSSHDTVLAIGTSLPAPEGRSLATILTSMIDRKHPQAGLVCDATVTAVLRHIGFGSDAGAVWVDPSGRWQVGPLHGAWAKPAAEHIGHAAREAARRKRIIELETEIEIAGSAISVIEMELEKLDARSAILRCETLAAPTDGNVRQALAQLNAFRGSVAGLRLRLSEAESRLTERRCTLSAETEKRDCDAADVGIVRWVDKIADFIDAVHDYSQALAELWPAIRAHSDARAQVAIAQERVVQAIQNRDIRQAQMREMQGKAAAALAKYQTLESAVGAAAREIQQRLKDASDRVERLRKDKETTKEQKNQKATDRAVAKHDIEKEQGDLKNEEQRRSIAIAALTAFVGTRQLAVAHSDFVVTEPGPWSVARAVELARRIEDALTDVDHSDGAWDRNQRDILRHFEVLQSSLRPHGHMPEASMSDGIFVVSIQFQSRACTIAELRDSVVAIIQERQQLLDAREREVLENYLIDEVAEHLHDLLHKALQWKDEINEELRERPMSTGMTLRFVWEPLPEGPSAFAEARRLLLGARDTWSPAQRAAVGEFLQQQIKTVRAVNVTGTWRDHLGEAFDYRKWHQFGVERKQDGVWKRLTRRTHGTGSGGEKAVALTLPQLAAAAAHYRSADKSAPRLILLDEAFVGVDKNMRAKCMDLLRVFDLDVVMTSESEWGCYPTVPAIAIYQLSAREDVDAVYATRWVWNGKQRVRDDSPLPEARPPAVDGQERNVMELR